MKKVFLITKREYITQVKKKSFVLLTLLAPILILLFGAIIAYMFKANETHYNIAVADESGVFQKIPSTSDISYQYIDVADVESVKATLKDTEALDGLLVIPKLENQDFNRLEKESMLYTNKKVSFDSRQKIATAISSEVRKEKIKNLGLDENEISDLNKSFTLNTENIKNKTKGDGDFEFGVKSALAGILMYATFMFIVIYGVRVMRSVLEEKNNRVVEIIISSVKPFDLMLGKILGVTLVALTQFITWIIMIVAAAVFFNQSFLSSPETLSGAASSASQFGNIEQMFGMISHSLLSLNYLSIIFVFIFYFLLGYIFYSSIYAAIGSAVDNETETQQFTIFAILPLTLGLYGSFSIMNNPDGPLAFWLSIIPLTSPVAMIARIPFGVPTWELAVSMLLLVGSALLMIFIAGKVYRVGILIYGNKVTFKEVLKWIRSS